MEAKRLAPKKPPRKYPPGVPIPNQTPKKVPPPVPPKPKRILKTIIFHGAAGDSAGCGAGGEGSWKGIAAVGTVGGAFGEGDAADKSLDPSLTTPLSDSSF